MFGADTAEAIEEQLTGEEPAEAQAQSRARSTRAGDPFGATSETPSGTTTETTAPEAPTEDDLRERAQETFVVDALTEALYPRDFDVEAFERLPVSLLAKRIERDHNTAHRFGAAMTMDEAIDEARSQEPQTRATVRQVQLPESRPRGN